MAAMTTQADRAAAPAGGAADRGELPPWLYPTPHAGRCYDQIGAICVGAGAAASPLVAAVCTATQHLLGGHWPLTWADLVPDPVTAAVTLALTPLVAAGLALYRHWLPHRELALIDADNEALLAEALAAVRAGDLDPTQLLETLAACADGYDGYRGGDRVDPRAGHGGHGAAVALAEGAQAA